MGKVVISVEDLGKCYRINHQQSGTSEGLRHVLNRWVTAPLRALKAGGQKSGASSLAPPASEDFWALRKVSFEIRQGEVAGIIGRNGAGKSTLLKVLSRITEPSVGRVRIKGRVASLLEVGTGFHPELTGRENIYLNGAILGMSRVEIKVKFDEIVAFAEVEKFLDTPVKRYSSGMYVRLAFAVAAHLEPEILIVDEVLAVGDAQFQKKCLGKMKDVSTKEGRTVLFVSHNMDAVSRLCSTALLLKGGSVELQGTTDQAVQCYLANLTQIGKPGGWVDMATPARKVQTRAAYFHSATYSGDKEGAWPVSEGEFWAKVRIVSNEDRIVPSLGITLCSQSLQKLVNADTLLLDQPISLQTGLNEIHVKIHRLHLKPGTYTVGLWLAYSVSYILDYLEAAFEIQVTDISGSRLDSEIQGDGSVTCDFTVHQVGKVTT